MSSQAYRMEKVSWKDKCNAKSTDESRLPRPNARPLHALPVQTDRNRPGPVRISTSEPSMSRNMYPLCVASLGLRSLEHGTHNSL